MSEHPAAQSFVHSFVVRVYRFDPTEHRELAGVVEAIDGSGTSAPFADTTQLAEVLRALLNAERLETGVKR